MPGDPMLGAPELGAPELIRLMARALDSLRVADARVFAFGAWDCELPVTGAEDRTTILVETGEIQRWFWVDVCEFDLADLCAWQFDHAITRTLRRRALSARNPEGTNIQGPQP